MKNKHLSATDRKDIEAGLNKNKTLTEIANSIDKSYNTVKYEIINHREKKYPSNFNGNRNLCMYFKDRSCKIKGLCNIEPCDNLCRSCKRHFCNNICLNYKEYLCERLTKKPYKGHRLTEEEIDYANTEIKRRIKNGQSLDAIVKTDDNIKKCTSSYYNYTNDGIFEFRNIDLVKKVSYKKRDKDKKEKDIPDEEKNKIQKLKVNRNYDCFVIFINKHKDYKITEMDTVIGKTTDKKVVLTLLFRKSNFMIAILLDNKTASKVNKELNLLKKKLTTELFILLFRIMLTDNGVEFTMIEEIETLEGDNQINLFFCDPGKSNQKGKIEKNHVELRKILPKGTTFNNLTQKDINLVMSHVNSYPRRLLNYKSPYEALIEEIGKEKADFIMNVLGYKVIDSKDIILSPKLLKK